MLTVDGLRVTYDGVTPAVDGVDLRVEDGEVVTILGPSGCGKSTILRAIAGLVTPDAGVVRIDGTDVLGVAPHERGVGLMFQDYALFPHRDVAGNVAFGPRMQRRTRADVQARVAEVLGLVGLRGFEHRAIASLSGGEQQRVALARALAPAPRLLMLDEPFGSLDRALRERLAVEVRALFVAIGSTAITVTHDQAEAFTLADRVVILRDGRIVQVGRPVDVWQHPADGFVARFLGLPNVVDVEIRGGAIVTPWGPVSSTRPDGPAVVVVPADTVHPMVSAADVVDGTGVQGAVGTPAFRGDHFLVPVTLPGGWVVEVAIRDGAVPPAGSAIRLALDRSRVFVTEA
jgi:thiamine transport system ATP-binding protein